MWTLLYAAAKWSKHLRRKRAQEENMKRYANKQNKEKKNKAFFFLCYASVVCFTTVKLTYVTEYWQKNDSTIGSVYWYSITIATSIRRVN